MLAWLWLTQLRGLYAHFFSAVGTPLFSFPGMGDIPVVYRTRFINVVPFVAMMLVTPKLGARRKSLGIALGLVVIFAGHLAFTAIAGQAWLGASHGGDLEDNFTVHIAGMLLSDSMPLLLWLLIAGSSFPLFRSGIPGTFRIFRAATEAPSEDPTDPPAEKLS